MIPEQRKKAIDALRSGNYTQCRRTIGNYITRQLCCIGVAADANGIDHSHVEIGLTSFAADFLGMSHDQKEWWIYWNDTQRLSFTEIANKIEAGEDLVPYDIAPSLP